MRKMAYIAAMVCGLAAAAIALDGKTYNIGPASPTGGVCRVSCKPGDIRRLDWNLGKTGKLELVKAVGTNILSVTTITNGVGYGTSVNTGIVGAGDYFRLTATTNTTAVIYTV